VLGFDSVNLTEVRLAPLALLGVKIIRATRAQNTEIRAMASSSSKAPPTGYPEFGVRQEVICRFFDPPLPRSTFYDFVDKGKVIPMKGIRGFYLLNASLSRLGLREVPSLPDQVATRSTEDIVQLAFTMIDPEIFLEPSWMLTVEELDLIEVDHARLIADRHRDSVNALGSVVEKFAYLRGVLDAQVMMEADMKSGEV
jgi:hypothetical protein